MHDWKRSLSLEYIASEFEDVDEDVFDDLSEIHFMAMKDSHDEGYEFNVYIFGRKTDEENIPVVHVRLPASCGIMDSENLFPDGSVMPGAVTKLFDPAFVKLMLSKRVNIIWNAGMQTQSVISPSASSIPLFPQYL